jgi:hypothetical protein
MRHADRVELYPHFSGLIAGRDEHAQPVEFPAFFRRTRHGGHPNGIAKLVTRFEVEPIHSRKCDRRRTEHAVSAPACRRAQRLP